MHLSDDKLRTRSLKCLCVVFWVSGGFLSMFESGARSKGLRRKFSTPITKKLQCIYNIQYKIRVNTTLLCYNPFMIQWWFLRFWCRWDIRMVYHVGILDTIQERERWEESKWRHPLIVFKNLQMTNIKAFEKLHLGHRIWLISYCP